MNIVIAFFVGVYTGALTALGVAVLMVTSARAECRRPKALGMTAEQVSLEREKFNESRAGH